MKNKVLVFDFDGTIADIMEVAPEVANKVFEVLNMPAMTRQEMDEYRSYTVTQAIKKMNMPIWKVPKAISESRRQLKLINRKIKPIKGMPAMIRKFDKHKDIEAMYVLTSNSPENVAEFLKKHKLEQCFEEVVAGLNLFNKPAKLKTLLHRHGHDLASTYMIGDESRDIEAGNKVGTRTVAVTWGLSLEGRLKATKPDNLVTTVKELEKVLSK